jgi:electron transfer flavoprotein-quinone oxidoreductase
MRDSWVIKDLETAAGIPHFIENPRVFTHYPQAVQRLFETVFTLTDQPTQKIFTKVFGSVKKDFLNVTTAKEMLGMRKI